jgi:hypothetical protein
MHGELQTRKNKSYRSITVLPLLLLEGALWVSSKWGQGKRASAQGKGMDVGARARGGQTSGVCRRSNRRQALAFVVQRGRKEERGNAQTVVRSTF